MTEEPGETSDPAPVDGGAGRHEGGGVSFRERWAWTLEMNTSMASPLIGFVCAVSIGVPLAVGIAAGYPRVGGWGAVGAFFTDMAVFQPGHRFRARIVAGAGGLVALGAFLGALCGIRSLSIYPVVVLWTIGAGLLVELGPQAALIGVSSATSIVFSASLRRLPDAGARRRRRDPGQRALHSAPGRAGPAPVGPVRRHDAAPPAPPDWPGRGRRRRRCGRR